MYDYKELLINRIQKQRSKEESEFKISIILTVWSLGISQMSVEKVLFFNFFFFKLIEYDSNQIKHI